MTTRAALKRGEQGLRLASSIFSEMRAEAQLPFGRLSLCRRRATLRRLAAAARKDGDAVRAAYLRRLAKI